MVCNSVTVFQSFFKVLFTDFREREVGRETDRQTDIDLLLHLFVHSFIGCFLHRPCHGIKPATSVYRDTTLPA